MAKKLKTLTLPNAQGEPVTYELHPDWDKIDGKPDNLDTSWENIEGKPESFPSDLTQASGILPIGNGGTGNANGYIRTGAKEGTTVGNNSTAEGYNTTASGNRAHAEGSGSDATGHISHAEGDGTIASGYAAHSENISCEARASGSHAEGFGTIATEAYQHVQGKFNIENPDKTYAHVVGNGGDPTSRSNAHTLDWSGNAWYAGSITATKLILGPESYGTSLPETGVEGQIFFLLGGSSGTATDDGNGIITLG